MKKLVERLHTWCFGSTGRMVLAVVGIVVIGLLVFHAGVAYGERRAFHRMHGSGIGMAPPFGFLSHSFIPEGHGAVGIISEVALPAVMVQTRDGEVETLIVGTSTTVRGIPNASLSDLHVGQNITALGEPDDTNAQQLDARFITISPGPTQ